MLLPRELSDQNQYDREVFAALLGPWTVEPDKSQAKESSEVDADALGKATLGMLVAVAILLWSRLMGGPINLNLEFEIFVFYFPFVLLVLATLYVRHRAEILRGASKRDEASPLHST